MSKKKKLEQIVIEVGGYAVDVYIHRKTAEGYLVSREKESMKLFHIKPDMILKKGSNK
tara:strand:- start:2052 stop:2225 length:174 start_codon:yes stop_codon:yes gene_type:complete